MQSVGTASTNSGQTIGPPISQMAMQAVTDPSPRNHVKKIRPAQESQVMKSQQDGKNMRKQQSLDSMGGYNANQAGGPANEQAIERTTPGSRGQRSRNPMNQTANRTHQFSENIDKKIPFQQTKMPERVQSSKSGIQKVANKVSKAEPSPNKTINTS